MAVKRKTGKKTGKCPASIFGRYGNQLDALMDASGAGMSVYDGVIQPAVSGINSIVDMIDAKKEGGDVSKKNNIYKPTKKDYQSIADKFSAMYQEDVERVGRGEPARFFGQLNDKPLENVNPEFDLLFSPVKGLGSAAKASSSYGISSEAVGRAGSILKEIGTGVLRWDDILRNGTRMMVDEVGKRLSGKAKDFWDKYPGGLIKAFVGRNATNMLPGMIGLDSGDNSSVSFQEAFKEASDQGLSEFEWNGKVYTTDKKKNGGVIGLKLSESDEKKFKDWYGRLSEYKGLNPNPDDASQYYDYRGFWKENPELVERMLNDDPDAHFVDTYKLPGHPTFSNESKYGGKELGGEWVVGDDGRGYYKPSPYTSSYIDRTIDYLRGTGEGLIINGEPIIIPKIPAKYRDGGTKKISYQDMKDKMSNLYKEDIERIRKGQPAIWYKSLNDKPLEESHPETLLFPYAGVIQGVIDEAEDYEDTGSLSGVASNALFSAAGSLIPRIIRDPLLYLAKLGVKPAKAKRLAKAIEESDLARYVRFPTYKTVGDRGVVPIGDKDKLFHNMNRDKLRWNEGMVELTPARTYKTGDPDALWWQAGTPHRGMERGVYVIDKDKANIIGRGTAERQTWGSADGEGAYLTGSQGLHDIEFYEVDNLTGATFRHVFKRDGGGDIDHPYYAERDNTNIPGVVYSDKFEKLGDELPFVGLIPEVSVSAELNPEEYREAMKRAEARRGRNYVYAGQKEAFPLLAGITGLGAASSLAGAGILGPVLNTSMDALGVISNPLDPTNYLSIYPGGLSLGKNIRDYLPDDYVALKDMEMHVPEETLSAIAGNFKRNIAPKFPKYYDDADISAARRFESGLRGESLSKYRDIVDFIRDNDIRDYKDLKEISSGLSQNEMMSVKGYISRRNQNIYNRDDMLKRVESYISDLDNFRYSDSFDLGEGIGGMYNTRLDLVAVKPYAGSETVIHELRHRMDTGPNAIKLNPMQLIYLDDAYKVGTNPMIESSGEQFEKIATNAELFERYRRKYKKYRKENGIDSSKYSIDDLYKYIDEQDPEDMLIELEHINAYGSDYANSIREYAGESHDKLNERIGKLKKALNYTPLILMGVSSYLSNGDNDYRDGGLIEKQDYIYNRLTSEYDIPPMQAAAIVANLTHESGLRTGALGDSGASYGLQQWRDERRKNLNQFAKERGHVEPTIDDQIDYLMYEYNNGRAFQFSTRGQNLYQTGKSKNKTFDYYQYSKSDFDNAASLRDAVIAWNQGVGRPNKEFAMNDRRYKIAADIAYRHGIKDGEKNYYNDMGYLPDGEMSGIHLPEVDIVANQPSQIPTEEQKKTDYYNTYGRQIVSQMMSFKPESQSVPTSQDVSKESDKMYQDAARISKAIAENKEAEKRKMLIEAFLPNIQLAVKGVTQVGK